MKPSRAIFIAVVLCAVTSHVADAFFARGHTIWYGTPQAVGYVGKCQETCCCRVCGSPTNDAFPYGLTTASITTNPPNPRVRGSSCHFSIWSDQQYNDSNGHPVTVPDTVFWTNYNVFLDYNKHIAPISCDCCKYSGVDTSCKEIIPAATQPTYFYLTGGKAQEYGSASLVFMNGVQLNSTDYVELRNDTLCGYLSPHPVLRATNVTAFNNSLNTRWNITRLPSRGCYKVCYFASSLTTPQWYDLGTLTVYAKPQVALSFKMGLKDAVLAGNTATMTFFGKSILSVFDDIAELRTSGSCGVGVPAISTASGSDGILDVVGGSEWCKPAVKAATTTHRPLNYIAIKYSDCGVNNRVYQSQTQWAMTFPVTAIDRTYTVCYKTANTWYNTGTIFVPGQQPAATALKQLYTATNGAYWKRNSGWSGSNACLFHGVRCDTSGNVISLYLGRNNLTGQIPWTMFNAPYFQTMTHVALDMNNLQGTVPKQFGALRKLKFLDLGYNNLTGSIPASLDYTSLYIVYLGNNALSGYLPVSIDTVGLSWSSYGNNVSDSPPDPVAPGCPTDITECSQKGSTDYGTLSCGFDGITKAACLAYGCCFNAQAPLSFGGTACFTRRRLTFKKYPPCRQLSCFPVHA